MAILQKIQRTIPLDDDAHACDEDLTHAVRIDDEDWPSVAHARVRRGDIECWLRVRMHADGRALVYGAAERAGALRDAKAGGQIVAAGDDLATVVVAVGSRLGADDACVMQVIAGLPS
jgi:hypothetical protein